MHHAYMYNGAFEKNHATLRPGATSYVGTDGDTRPLPPWPDAIDGMRIGYMEKNGKKFFAVRLQYGDTDIVLENPLALDPLVHMGNRRFSADPTLVGDEEASQLLDDVIRENPDRQPELALLINKINQTRRENRAGAE
jgi:hypothetical protein